MTAATNEAMLLRAAFEAAARGGSPDESYMQAVEAGVATLFPSEARRFAEALEVLLRAAQRVAGRQEAPVTSTPIGPFDYDGVVPM